MKPRAVIWDLDGTLSDDWLWYFDAVEQDPPIALVLPIAFPGTCIHLP